MKDRQTEKRDVVERKSSPLLSESRIGTTGLVLGMLALSVAVLHFFFGPINPPDPETTRDALNSLKELVAESSGFFSEPVKAESSINIDSIVEGSTIVAGVVALLLGFLSWVKREDTRVGISAIGLGAAAITFQFAVYAVMVIAVMVFLAILLSSIGAG